MSIAGALLLLIALSVFYLAGISVVGLHKVRPGPGQIVLSTTIGASTAAALYLLTKHAGITDIATTALLPLILLTLCLRRPEIRPRFDAPDWTDVSVLAICALYVTPTLIMGVRMGYGNYPAVFFAADTPYFLQQVHSLAKSPGYPPPSLEVWNFSYAYQYGMQAFVAMLVKITGLKAHTLMFAVVMPLVELAIAIMAYDISRHVCKERRAAVIALLVFLFGRHQYFPGYLLGDAWTFVTSIERFGFRYPSVTSSAGLLILLSIVRCLLDLDSVNMRRSAVWLVGLMPIFKLPYTVAAGGGLALIYLRRCLLNRNPACIVEPIAAAGLAGLGIYLFFHGETVSRYLFTVDFPGFMSMTRAYQHETAAVFICVFTAIALTTRTLTWVGNAGQLALFSLAPLLIFLPVSYRALNDFQIFDPLLHLSALLCGSLIAMTWLHRKRFAGAAAIAGTITAAFLVLPGMLSTLHHSMVVAVTPENGHEFADNRILADALERIPLEHTLIITNDLRYPADNFRRDNRQFQLASVFGHQNFASNLVYAGDRIINRPLYEAAINLFRRTSWPEAEISAFTSVVPITHLLIHKNFPHANDIPLRLIYSNDRYAVYRF
jgi:hypothetical protein